MRNNSDDCSVFRRCATVALCAFVCVAASSVASAQRREGPNEPLFRLLTTVPGTDIGVVARDAKSGELSSTAGAVLEQVHKDSPASRAGMRTGDVVVEFDGEVVRNQRQFSRLVQTTAPGRTVTATIVRAGRRLQLSVIVPTAPARQR